MKKPQRSGIVMNPLSTSLFSQGARAVLNVKISLSIFCIIVIFATASATAAMQRLSSTQLGQSLTAVTHCDNLSFSGSASYSVAGRTTFIASADFNSDGKPDLAALGSDTISVLLGDGSGTFVQLPTTFPAGSGAQNLLVGDFNGDGKLDLGVVNSSFGSSSVILVGFSILFGTGTGNFQPATIYPVDIQIGGEGC
jgi:hypothetical protein